MKVYTKKGDQGKTGLIGGTRVPKSSIRIESYGTVDELNSYLGLLRDKAIDEKSKEDIIYIQDRLFTIGSWLATDPEKGKMELPALFEEDIKFLEEEIDRMDESIEPMRFFVLPGGHETVSFCHIARCVCRRAERLVTALNEESEINSLIMPYLNRLSDYLFVYGRFLTVKLGAEEIPWKPKK
ncbi:cob(I)yrinic acid a,c-diamide adenosyltransferase [Crocinitomix algicola]|uniref:cob(I)yrinic acid a,c-diamide adenosyltransferase n=1 Tax=Crocinitomix algicola TaxID=1740263 RepID=UPI0008313DC2|nr:cob(I)yrinic acid a,c-diamide adenosyltransferase [Crocinitomix algicola]